MTDRQKPPQWSVQDGPDGPVEALVTFNYMRHWLRSQESRYPAAVQELLVAWCREHPEPTHDADPRGRCVWSSSSPVRLAGGGFVTVAGEMHRGRGTDRGRRVGSVQVLRLPYRALSSREARDVADELVRVVRLIEEGERRSDERRLAGGGCGGG